MLFSRNETSAHWSTDFVEHVRSVHFSIIVACLGLLALVQTKPKDVITARSQLVEIKQVVEQWKTDWVLLAISSKLKEKSVPAQPLDEVRIRVEYQTRHYVLYAN